MKTTLNPNGLKMTTVKMMVLTKMLPKKEVEKLYGCDYEFTIKDEMITHLEVWFNPKGNHNYEDKYRKEFKMNPVSVKIICD